MDGLWIAHFTAGAAHGNGLVILRGDEILGGDLSHTYQGEWHEDGSTVNARVRIDPWSEQAFSAAETSRDHPFMMTLSGSRTEKSATLHGHPDEQPDLPIQIEMERAA